MKIRFSFGPIEYALQLFDYPISLKADIKRRSRSARRNPGVFLISSPEPSSEVLLIPSELLGPLPSVLRVVQAPDMLPVDFFALPQQCEVGEVHCPVRSETASRRRT